MMRENEFAYIVGQLLGFLNAPDIQVYLQQNGIMMDEIEELEENLKKLARIFYK